MNKQIHPFNNTYFNCIKTSAIALILLAFSHIPVFSQNFSHPGGMHTKAQLSASYNKAAYDKMMKTANAALSHSHHAIADFSVEGAYVDGSAHVAMSQRLQLDSRDAYTCALVYSLTGESKYAEKASYFLMAWADINTKYSNDDGALVMSYAGTAMVMAGDVLWPYKGWSDSDRTQFKSWVKNVYYKAGNLIHAKQNNWGNWGTYACLLSAHFLNEEAAFDTYVKQVKYNINNQITDEGKMPKELSRGQRALSYTYFALAPMTASCAVVYNVTGENLFTYNNSRIKTAIDWWLPYMKNPESYPGDQPQLNPNSPSGRGGNLIEAMWYIYKDNDYNAYVQSARPVQHFGYNDAHHYAWAVPTLLPPSVTGGTVANKPPIVSISIAGSAFEAPATIAISASASDSDGSVTKVEFYNGSAKIGEDTSSPFSFTWGEVGKGAYSITAKATDNDGATKISAAVTITVTGDLSTNNPPAISLTFPVASATFTAPASVRLTATASDSDGSITKVEFYSGSNLLTTELKAPYDWTWSNVPTGSYTITAKATDNDGLISTSAAVTITVTGIAIEEYIVDNTDAGFSITGSWTTSTGLPGFWNTNYLHDGDNTANTTDAAKWISPITTTGNYNVFMRWTSEADRPDAAPVEVNYNGGIANLSVNQKNGGGTWVKIGTWSFASGSGDFVSIKASDTGNTIADAVRWVPVINSSARVESIETPVTAIETFMIVPNPAREIIQIQLNTLQEDNVHIQIFNQMGIEKMFLNKIVVSGENKITIPLDKLTSGMYTVRITLNKVTTVKRLIKGH